MREPIVVVFGNRWNACHEKPGAREQCGLPTVPFRWVVCTRCVGYPRCDSDGLLRVVMSVTVRFRWVAWNAKIHNTNPFLQKVIWLAMTCSVIVILDIVTTGTGKGPAAENSYTVRRTKIIRQHIIFENQRQPLASRTVKEKREFMYLYRFSRQLHRRDRPFICVGSSSPAHPRPWRPHSWTASPSPFLCTSPHEWLQQGWEDFLMICHTAKNLLGLQTSHFWKWNILVRRKKMVCWKQITPLTQILNLSFWESTAAENHHFEVGRPPGATMQCSAVRMVLLIYYRECHSGRLV